MRLDVIVLNGVSSAGKSSLARALQEKLAAPWLTFGIDTLITAMPYRLTGAPEGLVFEPDGRVVVGPTFLELEQRWRVGVAAMVRAGARVILDEVMLGGAEEQARWREALAGLQVLWVAVRCDLAEAARREGERGDRFIGLAASQSSIIHAGVAYDLEVDTTRASSDDCAQLIVAHVTATTAAQAGEP